MRVASLLGALCSLVVFGALPACGLLDPCTQLAERICGCELTEVARNACRSDRIQSQQDQLISTEEDRAFCTQALETCTCEALDRNRTDLCGFTRQLGDAEGGVEDASSDDGEGA